MLTLRCFNKVESPNLDWDGKLNLVYCSGKVEIQASTDQASGYPVSMYRTICPECGVMLQPVADFGRCDGIKSIKKFSGIVAEQKRSIKLVRKAGCSNA